MVLISPTSEPDTPPQFEMSPTLLHEDFYLTLLNVLNVLFKGRSPDVWTVTEEGVESLEAEAV